MVKLCHCDELADVLDDEASLLDLFVDGETPAAGRGARHRHLGIHPLLEPLVAALVSGQARARPALAAQKPVQALGRFSARILGFGAAVALLQKYVPNMFY